MIGKHKFDAFGGWVQESIDHYNHCSSGVGYTPGEISSFRIC